MSFHCLGDWAGPDGQRYVALMDTQATPKGSNEVEVESRPRYRCAVRKTNLSRNGCPKNG